MVVGRVNRRGRVVMAEIGRSIRVSGVVVALCACGALLVGCGAGGTDGGAGGAGVAERAGEVGEVGAEPVVRTARKGPVTMTVTASRSEITLAERLRLTVEVLAEDGVEVEMPDLAGRLEDLTIRGVQVFDERTEDGGRRIRQSYLLDAYLTGEVTIPELTAMFVDRRGGDDEVVRSGVTTDEIAIGVSSLVEGEFEPTEIRDVKRPVDWWGDRKWRWLWWVEVCVAGGLLVAWLVMMWVRRSRREPEPVLVVPHEWAMEALRRLEEANWVERGLVSEFYFELSRIVRRYIEMRFDVAASEWTTEEFLVNVQRSMKLPVEYRGMLGEFLSACDRVKFARYEPGREEIAVAFRSAREFVERTADRVSS
jgi:hypothetical protein